MCSFSLVAYVSFIMKEKFNLYVSVCGGTPAVSMITPSMSMAHVGTLLADVNVIQGPLILFSIVVLDPTEPCRTGPENSTDID